MSRAVPEWIGKTDDTPVPPRVRLRVFLAKGGRCHRCTRKIEHGQAWTCEHMKALINDGQNRESNLDVTCDWCLPVKNAEDVAEKSRVYRKQRKNYEGRKPSRGFYDKSKFKARIGGGLVDRRTGQPVSFNKQGVRNHGSTDRS
jgi:5-methylcytosine-specific restriction endonuclease McrA